MTGKDSADGPFGDIAAVGANGVYNVANYFLDGCGLAQAGANLQGFENFGDGAGLDYASASYPVSSGQTPHAGRETKKKRRRSKEERQLKAEEGNNSQAEHRTNKRAKVSTGRYQKLTPPAITKLKQSKCPSLTTS